MKIPVPCRVWNPAENKPISKNIPVVILSREKSENLIQEFIKYGAKNM